jgi:hypothetical protein
VSFKGKEHIRSKICVYDKPIEQVSSFKYLGYNIYEKNIDISIRILNYKRAVAIISQTFKPSLVQNHEWIKVYKTLAIPVLTYGSEDWTIRKSDRTRITANEIKFLRRTAGYTKLHKSRNTEIIRELKINSVLEHIDQYRNNWKQHVQRIDRSYISRQMIDLRPKGKISLGRPLKRWRETVTGHWGLIRVGKKKRNIYGAFIIYFFNLWLSVIKKHIKTEKRGRTKPSNIKLDSKQCHGLLVLGGHS